MSRGNEPDRIIFDVVYQLLEEFITFTKFKKSSIPELRFDELKTITIEELLKYGFKFVIMSSTDDDNAKDVIRYLISQYYDKQYLKANPKIQRLNDDVKELLKQFSAFFFQSGDTPMIHHKTITIADNFNIELFNDYSFSKNEPRKTRLKKIFFAMYNILSEKKSLSYSELINYLRQELGILENIGIAMESENDEIAGVPEDIEDSNSNDLEEVSMENEESTNSYIIVGNGDIETGIEDIEKINIAIDYFLRITTKRQTIIFGHYLLKENARINEELASVSADKENFKSLKELLNVKFNSLKGSFNVCNGTLYNENSKASENLKYVIKKYELDNNLQKALMQELINHFEDKLNNFGS
jgi:hypothetical protein